MIDQDTGSDVPTAGMELEDRLREAYERGKELADLTAENQRLRQGLGHIRKNGKCVQWCYACERTGLQERIRFTENYESLTFENQRLLEERDAVTRNMQAAQNVAGDMHLLANEQEQRAIKAEAALATTREERDKLQEDCNCAVEAVHLERQQTLAEVLAVVDKQRAEWGRYSQGERAVRDVRVALAALASSPTETVDAE